MFKKRSPNSASNIQPQYAEEVQTFSVDLYDLQIGKLDQPVDLEKFIIIINLFIIYIHVQNSCNLLTYMIIYINIYMIGYC